MKWKQKFEGKCLTTVFVQTKRFIKIPSLQCLRAQNNSGVKGLLADLSPRNNLRPMVHKTKTYFYIKSIPEIDRFVEKKI